MLYRTLGRTGFEVSQLGFGAMRLPMTGEGEQQRVDRDLAIPMLHKAFEGGVNYVDSAVMYCNNDSEACVGEALEAWKGGRIIVSTKNHYYGDDEKEWWQNLENSLERLRVDAIDIYNHHGMNTDRLEKDVQPRLRQWMEKARDQGLIRHICCSMHDNNGFLRRLADTGYADVVTLQYNMLDRQLEDGIAYAREQGMGVVVMGPVGGGRLGSDSEVFEAMLPDVRRVPELALRFVLANPNVTVALSGMSTIEHVEENLRVASDSRHLSDDEMRIIDEQLERLRKMSDLYCTGCGYCMPCEHKVNIPRIFSIYNSARVYGFWDRARRAYARMVKADPEKRGGDASLCTQCGECEEKCPQHIPIRQQLEEAHKALTASE